MRINNNISALNTWRGLTNTDSALGKSLEKLSSGLRINRAGDDAAGLAISEKMRGQIRGLNQASRNAQDGISLIQTAEGALNETHAILQRMRELAVQSANDTNTLDDRKELQKEINELISEIDRIANNTEFNTQKLLNGDSNDLKIQIGANENQSMTVSVAASAASNMGRAGLTKGNLTVSGFDFSTNSATVQIGSTTFELTKNYTGDIAGLAADLNAAFRNTEGVSVTGSGAELTFTAASAFSIVVANGAEGSDGSVSLGGAATTTATPDPTASGAPISSLVKDVDTATTGGVLDHDSAKAAITAIDNAIKSVSAERSKLGAMQNRLEHTIKNLGVASENLTAAESRIRDVDMAQEMMNFTRQNILSQAGTAMMAQANARPQSVLQLLG